MKFKIGQKIKLKSNIVSNGEILFKIGQISTIEYIFCPDNDYLYYGVRLKGMAQDEGIPITEIESINHDNVFYVDFSVKRDYVYKKIGEVIYVDFKNKRKAS